MLETINSYSAVIESDTVRIDLSGRGAAVINLDAQKLGQNVISEFFKTIQDKVLESLPKTGIAVSVIVPLYNEEEILASLVCKLVKEFSEFPFNTEFLLCENGSKDRTREIGQKLAEEHISVRLISIDKPSYGAAIRQGIYAARSDIVVIFNADLWCKKFFWEAVLLLGNGYDIVVGSKRLIESYDHRPLLRRIITRTFNAFLRYAFSFRGTDTHGMKAFRKARVCPVVERCKTSKEVFDTELILKSYRESLRICEIPTEVHDTRPARLSLIKRIPSTIRDLYVIWATL